ncbi:metalloendopeptidase [Exidia glandulosa HHB12029]|uniref:CAAX prenyl protease n=1 Tax=Exidia glandulosa HHB12029 TaxID=1314781 RepID=A0A165M820_EXIGL|nr:metalloendopeptidase [Exidia glandulosa HHB12029]
MADLLHSQLVALEDRLSWVKTDPVDWKFYVQLFSAGITLFESYLIMRQYPYFSKKAPPPALASEFSGDVFHKSQVYGRDKARFNFISGLYRGGLEQIILHYDLYAWAWSSAGSLLKRFGYGTEYEIPQSIVFCGVLYLLFTIPTIPLDIYSTFVLEANHGFNKTTPGLFVTDMLKSWLLCIVLGAPFLAAFLSILRWAGDRFVPWLMLFLIVFQMTMVVLYPTVIQPLFNKLSPLPEGTLRGRIERLASALSFPLTHLYEIDGSKRSSHSNAYFFGLPWSKHIVIYDTLIKQSKEEEVEAVLAHELGHWYYAHPTKLLLISQIHLFAILAFYPVFRHSPLFVRSFGFSSSVAAHPPLMVSFLLYQMILSPVESLVGLFMNFVTRRFEWQADAFATALASTIGPEKAATMGDISDMGDRLGRALVGLHRENLSSVWVDWLYSTWHHSHPTLAERLKALEKLKLGSATAADAAAKKEL